MARLLVTIGFTCALVAGMPAHAADYLDARMRSISPPDCVDASDMVAELAPAPVNRTYVRVQHVGDPGTAELDGEIARGISWDVGQLSGLTIPGAAYGLAQRGWRDVGPPDAASAFQLWCNGAGFVLNSRQFSHASPLMLEGPSVSVARDFEPPAGIFSNATSALTIDATVALPWLQSEAAPFVDGTAQASLFYYARDMTTGVTFAHVIALFDNRASGSGGAGDESVSADAYTAFVESPLIPRLSDGRITRFVTVSPQSAVASFGRAWSERRRFLAHVAYAQFREMLAQLRATALPDISPRPQDYRVTLFGFLAEIFPGVTRAHEVGLAGSVVDLALSEAYYDIAPIDAIEYYNAALDHYFIATRPDDITALDSGRFAGWVRTGESFRANPSFVTGTSPVCRIYLPPAFGDSHFFSAASAECAEVMRRFSQFVMEDAEVMFMALPDATTGGCPLDTTPVYRIWNGRASTNHRYTTRVATRNRMVEAGWTAEGYGPLGVGMCAPAG